MVKAIAPEEDRDPRRPVREGEMPGGASVSGLRCEMSRILPSPPQKREHQHPEPKAPPSMDRARDHAWESGGEATRARMHRQRHASPPPQSPTKERIETKSGITATLKPYSRMA